jgi:hypothetical protein
VGWEDGPGANADHALLGNAGHKVRSAWIIREDALPFEPPVHHVTEGVRGIQASLSRHRGAHASARN